MKYLVAGIFITIAQVVLILIFIVGGACVLIQLFSDTFKEQ